MLSGVNLNTLGGMSVEADGSAGAELKVTASANKTYKYKGGSYAA